MPTAYRTPQVKICGITNVEDARIAVEAGADYLGFIFYPPSKRSVSVADARRITIQLRQHERCPLLVGVFVNEQPTTMAQLLEFCQLDLAQLSGSELPSLVHDKDSPLYNRCFKALQPRSLSEALEEADRFVPVNPPSDRPTLLVDAYHPTLPGGTGQTADWEAATRLSQMIPGLMLAGGLNSENVARAIQAARPFAVDTASGVEATPGRKDHALIRSFIAAAKDPRARVFPASAAVE
jgi:phosphoribosylanthranilate isomerase